MLISGNWPLQLMKAMAESSEYIHFHRDLSAAAMSTDMSQVGIAILPSFYLSRFSFYININQVAI